MAANKNRGILEFKDITDDLGRVYIIVLFVSAVIWAFTAINAFDTPHLFKLALIYSLLLIFGFIGVSYDRRQKKLGLDSRIWESGKLKLKLGISVVFFFLWYIIFMKQGFAVATAATVPGGALFSVSPTLNFLLTAVLGPLAENIFFFGVINITVIMLLRKFVRNRVQGLIMAGLILASYPLFTQVPNSFIFLAASAGLVAITTLTQNKFLMKHAPFFASALLIGAVIFPKFHAYAYQLDERSYVAATYFGFFMCLIAGYIGLMPVDITHIANNVIAIGG